MSEQEKILNEIAKAKMINWNLEEFKRTHPKLYATIIAAMANFAKR